MSLNEFYSIASFIFNGGVMLWLAICAYITPKNIPIVGQERDWLVVLTVGWFGIWILSLLWVLLGHYILSVAT